MLEVNFRIKVFYVAAIELNFTKASRELFISQPAVSKHIQELEAAIGQALFVRYGSSLQLTEAGHLLFNSVENVMKEFESVDYQLNLLKGRITGQLIIGASTTLAQYIMPPIIAGFLATHEEVQATLYNGNTAQVAKWLHEKKINLGFVEGLPEDKALKYTEIMTDEIVFVAREGHSIFSQPSCHIDDLKTQEFVLREHGSGTNDIVFKKFKDFGVEVKELRCRMHMSSSESIKQYVAMSDCIGILSVHAVKAELDLGRLRRVEIEDFHIKRPLYMVHLHNNVSGLPLLFLKFIHKNGIGFAIT